MFKYASIAALIMVSNVEGIRLEAKKVPKWIEKEAENFVNEWGSNGVNVTKTDYDERIAKVEKASGENITPAQKKAYD